MICDNCGEETNTDSPICDICAKNAENDAIGSRRENGW